MKKSGTGQAHDQATLIASLLRANAYPHAVTGLKVMDTHISWVVLTGRFAYKIKKALRLQFLDFSTLELRRHFCEEELRLNQRWAPELYLDVVAIRGTVEQPTINGDGEPIEYAVKMLQFSQDSQLDRQLALGRLTSEDMLALAETIHGYHKSADVVPPMDDKEAVRTVSAPMYDNFGLLAPLADGAQLESLRRWTEQSLESRLPSEFVEVLPPGSTIDNVISDSFGVVGAGVSIEHGIPGETSPITGNPRYHFSFWGGWQTPVRFMSSCILSYLATRKCLSMRVILALLSARPTCCTGAANWIAPTTCSITHLYS